MKIIEKVVNDDSVKFLQETSDGLILETAFIEKKDRNIICFASQLGCTIGCRICYNGVFPNYFRSLNKNEIVEQCVNVINELNLLSKNKRILFSCMGVGEPLLNYDNVYEAMLELNKQFPNNSYALATTGIKTELIKKLAVDFNELPQFKLTISLHAADDLIRRKIIPIKLSLQDLKESIDFYKQHSKHNFEWNYVLLKGINDDRESVEKLIQYIDMNDFVKISQFNKIENSCFEPSHNFSEFISILKESDIKYKLFKSSGQKIGVGCGQMVTHYNKTKIKRK